MLTCIDRAKPNEVHLQDSQSPARLDLANIDLFRLLKRLVEWEHWFSSDAGVALPAAARDDLARLDELVGFQARERPKISQ